MHIYSYRYKIAVILLVLAIFLGASLLITKVAHGDTYVWTWTYPASNITATTATLTGLVSPNWNAVSYWFEYGVTPAMGSTNMFKSLYGVSSTYISFPISNLVPNTAYYFRLVVQTPETVIIGPTFNFTTLAAGGNGTSYGNSGNSIVGAGTQEIQPPQNATSTNNPQITCVTLIPAAASPSITPGKSLNLVLAYKNSCSFNIENVFMKVILPPGTVFVSTSYSVFNQDANGITYNLGSLPAGYQSSINVEVMASNTLNPGDSLMFSSVLNFNDDKGSFQSISGYLTLPVGEKLPLGATVIGTVGNLLKNWTFDLILMVVTAFLIYWFFFKNRQEKKDEDEEDVLEAEPMPVSETNA